MPGVKRKQTETTKSISKKPRTAAAVPKPLKPTKSKPVPVAEPNDIVESDTTENEEDFYGLSDSSQGAGEESSGSASDVDTEKEDAGVDVPSTSTKAKINGTKPAGNATQNPNPSSSKESHAKQKVLAKERKAAKPLADEIQRSKKLWEKLRRKSHVAKEERNKLVAELFEIITGRVKDFVFKHDSVRVIQCALKYANMEHRKMIANELKGEFRALAESRYAKFLIGKMLVEGDAEVRDLVIPEFYGHVRRLINHPEASWILDDIYRGIATASQKAILLREWYGAEFAIFKVDEKVAHIATLSEIFAQTPEKRKPIMQYLLQLIYQLIQKKLTGFTMLHDAVLQYLLNTKPGTEEATEFLELLKGDEEGDLLKNMAFTKSGSRVACLALAYGSAKDRKNILRVYKDNVETLAYDKYGHFVLLTALDVIDDTVLTSKAIFPDLLGDAKAPETQHEKITALAAHPIGRIPLLYLLTSNTKSLLPEPDLELLPEIHAIRTTTSKKDPDTRRRELVRHLAAPLLATITAATPRLAESPFGTHFITETLLGTTDADPAAKDAALHAVAALAPENWDSVPLGRMLKTLALGGRFDVAAKKVVPVQPALGFADVLYGAIKDELVRWAVSNSSFVVVNMLDAEGFTYGEEVKAALKKAVKELREAADGGREREAVGEGEGAKKRRQEEKAKKEVVDGKAKTKGKAKGKGAGNANGNAGAKILLERIS
ncbi:hypothetical protein B0A49_03563 [Cryomyces minteri]|uniref:PUM-HD domain-containing protein n=1 Tax=Cryomyces minteri TaxID=331657 RepID=A0A4U0XDU7_9PEZI|nr:hypothetical protein B0A49_05157 [Cryomyces minteri]TKA73698.1 hypothetical protein B0A49_03563 [Cryomyces minteri]